MYVRTTIVNQAGSMIELSGFNHNMQLAKACMNILQQMLQAYYTLYYECTTEELL